MPESWVVRGARERAEVVAEFLAPLARHDTTALPVRAIARRDGCPIRSDYEQQELRAAAESKYDDDRDYHLANAAQYGVGTEDHCRRVTQALTVAVKRGLVARVRRGKGPWRYYVPGGSSFSEGEALPNS